MTAAACRIGDARNVTARPLRRLIGAAAVKPQITTRAKHATPLAERLRSRLDIPEDPTACWEFTGCRNHSGYGELTMRGYSTKLTHRLAYQLANGPIPAGLCVLHRCDNPPCCNPAHLFLGTRIDNNADMRAKGRDSTPPRNDVRGEKNGHAKLTAARVLEIRARAARGERITYLADEFGVSHGLISGIVSGARWSWL
jgi:hypothetical protein